MNVSWRESTGGNNMFQLTLDGWPYQPPGIPVFTAGLYFDWMPGGASNANYVNIPPTLSGIDGYVSWTCNDGNGTNWIAQTYQWSGNGQWIEGQLLAANVVNTGPTLSDPNGQAILEWTMAVGTTPVVPSQLDSQGHVIMGYVPTPPLLFPFNGNNLVTMWGVTAVSNINIVDITPGFSQPEPASLALLMLALGGPVGLKLRRRRK